MIYEIHSCAATEKKELQQFIDRHWKKGHVLATSETLLDFQHRNNDGSYNFLIARNTVSGEIDGVFGYMPLISSPGVYYGAIWKVRDDINNNEIKLLGAYLWKRMTKLPGFKAYAANGISAMAKQFYQRAGLTLGCLRQYYILSEQTPVYRIAKIDGARPSVPVETAEARQIRITTVDVAIADTIRYPYYPVKNKAYLQVRYADHPYYHYDFRGIFNQERLLAVLVTRTIEAQGAKCLRIVDVYGGLEYCPSLYSAVQQLLRDENAEYIDCMNYGIDPEVFRRIGFSELDPDNTETIIPNYFEPFEQSNVRIECAHTQSGQFVIFKGDSDQDRPNIIPSI